MTEDWKDIRRKRLKLSDDASTSSAGPMASLLTTALLGSDGFLSVDCSEDAKKVREHVANIKNLQCACGSTVNVTKTDIIQKFDSIIAASKRKPNVLKALEDVADDDEVLNCVDIHLRCSANRCKLCFGCGTVLTSSKQAHVATGDGLEIHWHCDQERLTILWVLLCGYDDKKKHQPQPLPILSSRRDVSTKDKMGPRKGVGYGSDQPYAFPTPSVGYGPMPPAAAPPSHMDGFPWAMASSVPPFPFGNITTNAFFGKGQTLAGPEHSEQYNDDGHFKQEPMFSKKSGYRRRGKTNPDDIMATKVIGVLSLVLPSMQCHTASMLRCSSLMDFAADLLRNDDIQDVVKRAGVYESVLAVVHLLAQDSTTNIIVAGKRTAAQPGRNLLKLSFNEPTVRDGVTLGQTQSLLTCMENLHMHCQVIIETISKVYKDDVLDENNQKTLYICRSVCDLVDLIKRVSPALDEAPTAAQIDSSDVARAEAERKKEGIDAWHKDSAVMELPDHVILSTSHYAQQANDYVGSSHGKTGRMKKILDDISILKTSLPPGIFVRHCETRIDIMKVLIIGPKDTPYANALFEFDLACPANYPNAPPDMFFCTSGGGVHAINPNLYNNGKVCLSLLGTWSHGETWRPGQSTLLQLLVSIQAMIFVDEPYCNEPGYTGREGTDASLNYNRNLYPTIVKHGMMDWIDSSSVQDEKVGYGGLALDKDGANKTTIWSEIARKHFDAHGDEILVTVGQWIEESKAVKKRGLPPWAGTGWQGRTLRASEAATKPEANINWQAGATLREKLEEALKQLKQLKQNRSSGFDGYSY